jgi:hypothetical protein
MQIRSAFARKYSACAIVGKHNLDPLSQENESSPRRPNPAEEFLAEKPRQQKKITPASHHTPQP